MTSRHLAAPRPIRRIGWVAALGVCFALYLMLHLKVTALHADVVQAEREIVQLEEQKLLLETEFLTRSNHVQLATWNRVDFGFQPPRADQFVGSARELASFGVPRSANSPAPIRLAGFNTGEDLPEFPQLVSPLTGEPVDEAVIEPREEQRRSNGGLAVTVITGSVAAARGGAGDAGERDIIVASMGAAQQ